MTLTAFLDGSDIGTTRVRLGDFGLSTRADGTGAFGSIVFDDPDGTMTVRGWMPIYLEDDECEAAPRLFTGWIWDRTYRRGPYRHGAGREIECQLLDTNALLSFILITNPDGKRPAETHNERINWLLASYLLGLVVDNGLVNDSNPRPFGEADYRPQYPNDVLNDIAGPIFRTYFTYWDQEQEEVALFFDIPVATTFTSDLTISNVLSDTGDIDDPDTECFPPMVDAELSRSPSEVYALIYYRYAKGVVIEKNVDTFNEFFPDLGYRGLAVENSRIGSEASARIMAQTLLTRYSGEADTVTVTVRLPPSKAGLIDAGQRIAVRFSHLPGYDPQVFTRVTARTIKQSMITDRDGTRRYYDLTLELNTHGLTSVGGGEPPTEFPHPPPGPITIVQKDAGISNRTMPNPIAPGNLLIYGETARVDIFAHADYTPISDETEDGAGGKTRWFYRIAEAGESQSLAGFDLDKAVAWYELSGGNPDTITWIDRTDADTGDAYAIATGSLSAVAGSMAFASATLGDGGGFDAGPGYSGAYTPGAGWTEDLDSKVQSGHPASWFAHQSVASAASVAASATFLNDGQGPWPWGAQTIVISPGVESENPPDPAQPVGPETVVMVGDTGVTAYPFADGSLHVYVDNTDQTAAITSYDGSCGLFTLAFTPTPTEVVTVYYQGR